LFNFYQVSISEEFHLYCDHSDLAPWAQSAFFFGGFISGYLFSYVSERIGRRYKSIKSRLNLLSVLILLTVSILFCALAPNYEWFLGGYFMIGFCLFGYETSIYIYIG
jgi:MFS family permease